MDPAMQISLQPSFQPTQESDSMDQSLPTSLESDGNSLSRADSDHLHLLESVIPLVRVIPRRAFYVLVCLVCSANAIAMLCIFGKTLIQQPFALWEFIVIFTALPAAVAGYELRHWDPERSQGSKFEDMCSHKDSLLAVCLAMVPPLNAKIYTFGSPHIRKVPTLVTAAWPTAKICVHFTIILAICFPLQFIYIPKKRPEWSTITRRALVGLLAFYFELAVLFFFLFFYWPNGGDYSWITAIADNGNQWLPVQGVLLIETARFLHTGDWQGIPVMAIFQAGWIIGFAIWQPAGYSALQFLWKVPGVYSQGLLVILCFCQLLLLLLAIQLTKRMRLRQSRVHNSHQSYAARPPIMLPENPCRRRATLFMSSFVGQNIMFMANGLFSFILYKTMEKTFNEEMRSSIVLVLSGFDQQFDTIKLIQVTWVLGLLSVFIASYNIFVDKWKGPVAKRITSILPHDAQYRLLAWLKAAMVWLKVAIIGFTDFGSTASPVLVQFVAVVSTIGVLGLATYTALDYARKALPLPYLHGKYRSCKTLLACIIISNVTIQFLTTVLIVGKLTGAFFGDHASFVVAMRQISPGAMLSLGSYYSSLWICFLNEFTCHIRGIGLCLWFASPRGTYSVNMPTGMRACAANLVSYPAIIFMDTQLDCTPSRLGNMLTGYPLGGFEGSWAPPMVTYASLLLAVVAFAAHWACGPPC